MNCAETRLMMHAYVDGELDLVRSLDVEGHIQSCTACAAENQSLRSLRSALRSASLNHAAPASLRNKVRQIIPAPDEKPVRARQPWLWQWLTLGATAAALCLLVTRPSGSNDGDLVANELVASHVRSLMPGHLTDVVSSDQHTVKPWFNGKLDFSPDVKDFVAQGFPLVGGRLDYVAGRDVSVLVYRRNQHYINVFVWPASDIHSGRLTAENIRGYNFASRDVRGLRYVLVSDLNAGDLNELADLIGK